MNYTQEQQAVINEAHSEIVVLAPPGSGKTHTMVGAVQRFLDSNPPADDEHVSVITFTNKAAGEIRSRLIDYAYQVEVSTIHSWSYKELKRLSNKYAFRIRLLEEDKIKEILWMLAKEYTFLNRNALNYLYSYVMGNVPLPEQGQLSTDFSLIKDKYLDYKRRRYLYDFTDLPLYLQHTLDRYNEAIKLHGLFVDEFQDVDNVQLDLFSRTIAEKKFYIGDPRQAIYYFRGADPEVFNKLPETFKIMRLGTNYRSYQEILDYAYRDKGDWVPIAVRGFGGIVKELFTSADIQEHADAVFLCRTNREVQDLTQAGFNAMTVHQAKGLEFNKVCVVNFHADSEEDENILFVAQTRAKDVLLNIDQRIIYDYIRRETSIKAF